MTPDLDAMAEEYAAECFKIWGDSVTMMRGVCNDDIPAEAFKSGANAMLEICQKEIEKLKAELDALKIYKQNGVCDFAQINSELRDQLQREREASAKLVEDIEEEIETLIANDQEPQHPGRKHFNNKEAWEMYRELSAAIAKYLSEALENHRKRGEG